MGSAPTPWAEHRAVAETIGQAVADAVAAKVGTHVDLGIAAACDPSELVGGRPVPLHAIVVRMGHPLRDVMVFISSLREDVVRPLVEAAADATLRALDISTGAAGAYVIEDAIEFATTDEALEQCDALYLEALYGLELPTGELQMVLGTGLLESAGCLLAGTPDPFAEAPPEAVQVPERDTLELDGTATPDEGGERYEFGEGSIGDDAHGGLATGAVGTAGASQLETFDAMLAEQEQADAAHAAGGAGAPGTVQGGDGTWVPEEAATRWTQLLSGVEVELSAELGRADLALGEITSLAADSVLTLDQLVQEPVAVYVNGTRYATARLVVVDGEYGIEILEVVDQSAATAAALAA